MNMPTSPSTDEIVPSLLSCVRSAVEGKPLDRHGLETALVQVLVCATHCDDYLPRLVAAKLDANSSLTPEDLVFLHEHGLRQLSDTKLIALARDPGLLLLLSETMPAIMSEDFFHEWEMAAGVIVPACTRTSELTAHDSNSEVRPAMRYRRRLLTIVGCVAVLLILIGYIARSMYLNTPDPIANVLGLQGEATYVHESGDTSFPTISVHVTLPPPPELYVTLVLLPLDSNGTLSPSGRTYVVFYNDPRFVYHKETGEQGVPMTETEIIFDNPLDDEDQRSDVSVIAIASRKPANTEIKDVVDDLSTAGLDSSRPDDVARKILESLALINTDIVGWGQFPLRPANPN